MKQWMFPLVLAGLLTACSGTPKPADEPTTGPAAQEAVQQEEVVKEDPIDIYVRNNAERLANFAMRFANASDLPKEIKAALEDEAFKKNKKLMLGNILPMIVDEMEVQDIDNESDWKIAEIKYKAMKDNK